MTLRPSALAAAIVLAASAFVGHASAREVPIAIAPDDSFSTLFQSSHSTPGAFTDTFTIGSITSGTAWVDLLSWSPGNSRGIDFTAASLGGHALSLGSLGPFDFGSLAPTAFTGPLTLTVSGIVRGAQGRDATYWVALGGNALSASPSMPTAPVPEPGTYALMLAGLSAVALIARRRKPR